MTVLPLIERELRVRARSWATYWIRFVVVLVGLLICLPQLIFAGPFGTAATTGKYVFDAIVVAAFMLSCAACLLTADLISAERREGTLGLLFLTRVKGLDVLLGKLGAGGLPGLCALAALMPILMIPILAGGVTGGEAARKGLALVNTLFVALALGLWASAAHHDRFKAARQALLSLLLLLLLPLLLHTLPGRSAAGWRVPPDYYLGLLSPLLTLISATDGSYRASSASYWVSLGIVHGLAWLLLVRAVVRLGQSVPDEANSSATSESAHSHEDAVSVRLSKRRHFGRDARPVEWLVQRQRGLRATLWWAAVAGFFYYIGFRVFGRFLPFGFSAVSYILTS